VSERGDLIAVVPRGVEELAAAEIRALGGGIGQTRVERGRVRFAGPPDAAMRANLRLSLCERVLVPVLDVPADTSTSLARAMRSVPWERYFAAAVPVDVHSSTRACKLHHGEAIADCVRDGLLARGLDPVGDGEPISVDVRGTADFFTVCIDTTGPSLARRGLRRATGKAPIREHLAAACLRASGWDGRTPFLDPMCGAGTMLLEAVAYARGVWPGLGRPFALERFPVADLARLTTLRASAPAGRADLPPILGRDRDSGAVRASRGNLARAGADGVVDLARAALMSLQVGDLRGGTAILNPPYGRRVAEPKRGAEGSDRASPAFEREPGEEADSGEAVAGDVGFETSRRGAVERTEPSESLVAAWAGWGALLRERLPGWRAFVLSPHPQLARAIGTLGKPLLRFNHGGIPVVVWRVL
jgi:putative N6-adenine-specific DNA methylase